MAKGTQDLGLAILPLDKQQFLAIAGLFCLLPLIWFLIMKLDRFFFSMFGRNDEWTYNCGNLCCHGTSRASCLQWPQPQ